MAGTRALLARVQQLEKARSPVSAFERGSGSVEAWAAEMAKGIADGVFDQADMTVVIASVRRWHLDRVFAK